MARTEERKLNQCEKIIQYMTEEGGITPLDALREFGCMRLASRISDLKKAGFVISKEMVSAKNKRGETVRFAFYRLGRDICS
jgi:hypothetical protein